ncbi:hypothetical protein PM082_023106 [Marasmius tenuissimus]|nr:hypothetical protein PM082_023106 [Marasmius tenuissimus]
MEFGIDTPFARVLNTNYPPSTEELRSLRDLVQAPEEQIRQLDEEISRLQAKRQRLKQFVDLHRALLSPFRRLPADIWRLIFVKTLPENILGLCTRTTKSSPLLLTTICRSWREIALSTPSLWNSIHIHFPIVESSETPNPDCIARLHERKECLKAWLDKSGCLPITVSLAAQTYSLDGSSRSRPSVSISEPSPTLTIELTELLIQYLPRWRTAVFNSGIYLLDLAPLESLPASSLSSLESFYSFGALHNKYGQTIDHVDNDLFSPSPLENLLTKARSLRRLELFYDNISAETLLLPIPWHHLTELSIIFPVLLNRHSSLDPGQLMQGLAAKCHSLTTLTIILSGFNIRADTTATISHPVQWPSLQNFRISFLDNAIQYATLFAPVNTSNDLEFRPAVIQIFDSITLPSLRRLSVGFYGDDEDSDSDLNHASHLPFEDLLQRSQCPLTHLEIFHPRIVAVEAVIRVLQQLETLVSVNLGYGRLTETKRRQSFGLGYFMEPPEPSWVNRNVNASSTWRKVWLDRILREFLQAGTDADVESWADGIPVLPLCPRLEELNIGGCALDDRDTLLDFATKTRRESLGTFRVDLGRPLQGDVWKIFESLQMQRPTQDSDTKRGVRDIGGVMLDWRWDETSEDTVSMLDTAATGLPQEGSWWNESLWL